MSRASALLLLSISLAISGAPAAAAVPAMQRQVHPAPDQVLQRWARAIERRDWRAVRALWGQGGADSGLSPAAFAARWRHLRHPRVSFSDGQQEGAAGSLYYTATITIADGRRRFTAPVTLRRANDVPGAIAEQLRWHFDRTVRIPLTGKF